MNKFVTGALALGVLGTVGYADPAEDSEWLELDSEIGSLASAVPAQGPIAGWAALIRASYVYTSDADPDISGFFGDDARVAAWGEVGDYSWRISLNAGPFESGGFDFELEDAYVRFNCGDYFTTMVGSFRPNVLRSSYTWEENQFFYNRSVLGMEFDFFDLGIGAEGMFEDFGWYAQVLNGQDGIEDTHLWLLRGEYNFNGGAGDYLGAFGSSDDLQGTVGIVYAQDDTTTGDSSMFAFDAHGSVAQAGFGFEIASTDDQFVGGLGLVEGDSEPWSIYGTYALNQEFEVGFRFEDIDDMDDSTLWTAGVSWYHSGKNAKWNAEISDFDSDVDTDDAFIAQVGVTVGASN